MKTQKNKREELKKLSKRFDIFHDYLLKNGMSYVLLSQAKEIAMNAFHSENITVLKRISKELDVWFRELPSENRLELQQILLNELNEEIKDNSAIKLEKIVIKGRINNDKEYELVLNRVEKIYSNDHLEDEVIILNKLLSEYHKRTDNKLR